MNDFLNAFMSNLHLYETVAVVGILAAAAFLIILRVCYTKTYRANPRQQ